MSPSHNDAVHRLAPSALLRIPEDWTGEQALAVFEFLERFATAIWDRYENQMIPALLEQQAIMDHEEAIDCPPLRDDELHDDPFDENSIPF